MNWQEVVREAATLLIQFADVTVWPATVLGLAYFFRLEIRKAARKLTKLRWRDVEAVFDEVSSAPKALPAETEETPDSLPSARKDHTEPIAEPERERLESLALDQAQVELEAEVSRGVFFFKRPDLSFDGSALSEDTFTVVEVLITQGDEVSEARVSAILGKVRDLEKELERRNIRPEAHLLLIVVAASGDPEDQSRIQGSLRKRFFRLARREVRVYTPSQMEMTQKTSNAEGDGDAS